MANKLKELRMYELELGMVVEYDGNVYKVVEAGTDGDIDDLFFVEQMFPGAWNKDQLDVYDIFEDAEEAELVYVREDTIPGHKQQALTDSLRAQVAGKQQQSLTDKFKAQLAKPQGKVDAQYRGPIATGSLDLATPMKFEPKDAVARQSALTANLRAQKAEGQASQAKLTAQLTAKKVNQLEGSVDSVFRDTNHVVDGLVTRTEKTASQATSALFKASSVENEVRELGHDVDDLAHRVGKIETKQKLEETKMNIQKQLNEKLALQSKLNASLAKHKEEKGMSKLLGNFKGSFGKVSGKFALAATGGLAIRKGITGEFVTFDGSQITDVTGLTLDFNVPAFRLPVAADKVEKGDIVLNNAAYGFVTSVSDGYVEVVNVETNTRGSVLPTKNVILNGSFYTVVKTLDVAGKNGFDPTLLLLMGKEDSSSDDILPFLLMQGGLGGQDAGAINPMMLLALKDNAEDLLPLLLMQQGGVAGEGQAFNPLMFLAMGEGKTDMKDILLMQAVSGQNIFGGQTPAKVEAPKAEVKTQSKK